MCVNSLTREPANLVCRTWGITKTELKHKTDEQISPVNSLEPWDQSDRQKQTKLEDKVYSLHNDMKPKRNCFKTVSELFPNRFVSVSFRCAGSFGSCRISPSRFLAKLHKESTKADIALVVWALLVLYCVFCVLRIFLLLSHYWISQCVNGISG